MAELKWGAGTHAGQIRPQNEDNLYVDDDGVFVVADGMGGHEAGEVASHIAVERIREALEGGERLTAERVIDAISEANGDIFRAAIANPGQAGMGTTVTAIAVVDDPMAGRGAPNIDDNDPIDTDPSGNPRVTPVTPAVLPEALVLANVGDSRTYLLRHDRLRRITVDHSYVQELVSTGHITDDEARHHPRRNIITRALGIEPDVKVDWWTLPLVRGDRFVLCSDGLVDEVADDDIADVLRTLSDPQEAADRLIVMANEAGGRDNVTVVVVDVLDGDDPPDPTQELDLVPTWADDTEPDGTPLPPPMVGEPAALAPAGTEPSTDGADPTATRPGDDNGAAAEAKVSRRQRRRDRKAAKRRAGADDAPSEDGDGDAATTSGDADADDTTASDAGDRPRQPRLGRAVAAFVVLAIVITAAVAVGAWARRGYYVDFDGDDDVTVYQGRKGGLLWIDPTVDSHGPSRDQLSDDAIALVEEQPTFSDRDDAIEFITELEPADDDTSADDETAGDDEAGSGNESDSDTTTDDSAPDTTEG